jgi:hypothetical protein
MPNNKVIIFTNNEAPYVKYEILLGHRFEDMNIEEFSILMENYGLESTLLRPLSGERVVNFFDSFKGDFENKLIEITEYFDLDGQNPRHLSIYFGRADTSRERFNLYKILENSISSIMGAPVISVGEKALYFKEGKPYGWEYVKGFKQEYIHLPYEDLIIESEGSLIGEGIYGTGWFDNPEKNTKWDTALLQMQRDHISVSFSKD